MLSREVMGSLALGILWVNALLIAAAAGQELRALLARRRRLAGLVRGRLVRGDGPGGALAAHRIEQTGRAAADGAIVFADRAASGEIFGGELALEGGERLAIAPGPGEVWLGPGEVAQAGSCPSEGAFHEAWEPARKARGFARVLEARLAGEREIWTLPPGAAERLVAAIDPRAVLARKAALAAGFIALELAATAACTALALWPPRFGPVSTLGAAAGLAFFLLVQPAATAVRDAVRVPSRAVVRGRWTRAD